MRHSVLVRIVFLHEREILYPFLSPTKSKSSFTKEFLFFIFVNKMCHTKQQNDGPNEKLKEFFSIS